MKPAPCLYNSTYVTAIELHTVTKYDHISRTYLAVMGIRANTPFCERHSRSPNPQNVMRQPLIETSKPDVVTPSSALYLQKLATGLPSTVIRMCTRIQSTHAHSDWDWCRKLDGKSLTLESCSEKNILKTLRVTSENCFESSVRPLPIIDVRVETRDQNFR